MFVRSGGSTLGRWLALLELQVIWGNRKLAVRVGYIPGARRGPEHVRSNGPDQRKFPDFGNFVPRNPQRHRRPEEHGVHERFNMPEPSWTGSAPQPSSGCLANRIANDDRFLRDLARLEHEARGRDALRIYVEGAGEMKAKEALKKLPGGSRRAKTPGFGTGRGAAAREWGARCRDGRRRHAPRCGPGVRAAEGCVVERRLCRRADGPVDRTGGCANMRCRARAARAPHPRYRRVRRPGAGCRTIRASRSALHLLHCRARRGGRCCEWLAMVPPPCGTAGPFGSSSKPTRKS